MQYVAQDFLNACRAGLVLAGQTDEGKPEWIGKDRNWTAYEWLTDGVYDDLEDKGEALINEYLALA